VVSFLSFSIDTPERFDRVRQPASYQSVVKNIETFLEVNAGNDCPIETQVSMVRTADATDEDVARFVDIWRDQVDRIRIYQEHSTDGRFGSLVSQRPVREPCVMPFYEMLIYFDGQVGRCNHDWDGPPLAELGSATISEVWHSDVYQELRHQHENLNIRDSVCRHCDSWYPREGDQGTGKVETR
ncbi:hypothetical protein GF348_14325, partial [candidate division KSB3 bacterium]|nr:hypothetical protein [candidate division KSB3 bacterium]